MGAGYLCVYRSYEVVKGCMKLCGDDENDMYDLIAHIGDYVCVETKQRTLYLLNISIISCRKVSITFKL